MTDLLIETSEGLTLRHEIAGGGARTAAALVDLSIYVVGLVLAGALVFGLSVADPTGLSRFVAGLLVGGVLGLLVLYHAGFGLLLDGRTPGKLLLGLRVVDVHGYPARGTSHVLRALFFVPEAILFVPLPLGLVLYSVSARHQRLGDLVAGTLVVRETRPHETADPYPNTRWNALTRRRLALTPATAARLSLEDLTFLRRLLGASEVASSARVALVRDAVRHYGRRLELAVPHEPDEEEGREILRELYVFLRDARAVSQS